jgi:hypothetical protein
MFFFCLKTTPTFLQLVIVHVDIRIEYPNITALITSNITTHSCDAKSKKRSRLCLQSQGNDFGLQELQVVFVDVLFYLDKIIVLFGFLQLLSQVHHVLVLFRRLLAE